MDGATVSTFTPSFTWHRSGGAKSYVLECSSSFDFSVDRSIVTVDAIEDTTCRLPLCLDGGESYFWRIAAVNEEGASAFSGVRTFEIGEVPVFSHDTIVELTSDPTDDTCPALTQGDETTWLVWDSSRDGNSELYYKTSDDCAESWSDAMRLTFDPASDAHPAVVGRSGRGAWVFWESMRDGNAEIYHTQYDGATWSEPHSASLDAAADQDPAVAVDGDGLLWLVWSSDREGRNFEVYSATHDGETWSPTSRVTYSSARDAQPVVVSVSGGETWLIWITDRDGNLEVYTKSHDGVSWADDVRLTNTMGAETHPSVARTDDGRIWLAYMRGGAVYYRVNEAGVWTDETVLPTQTSFGSASVDWPAVAQACDGRVHIAYQATDGGSRNILLQRSNYLSTDVSDPIDHAAPVVALERAFPNPLTASTSIAFELRESTDVTLAIYDVAGRLVRTLIEGPADAGRRALAWDARDDAGEKVAAGVYFARLEAGPDAVTRKLVVIHSKRAPTR